MVPAEKIDMGTYKCLYTHWLDLQSVKFQVFAHVLTRPLLKQRYSEIWFVLKLVTLETLAFGFIINLSCRWWEITCLVNVVQGKVS